ncbi:MAG: replication terminator protein [Deltaproteobacteria bacterium]|nr:replication terminator protein [Deltaproteobacteria bacterium]
MHTKEELLSLSNIGDGAAMEMFDLELGRILKNIMDPNTEPKAAREIVLKVKFRPDEDRDLAQVDVAVSSKLAGSKAFMTRVIFGKDSRGRMEARELETGQRSLFENKGNVISMNQEGGE